MFLEILILLLAVPVGYLIAWLARDELVVGRKWFKILIVISLISAILAIYFRKTDIFFSSSFISIATLISLVKSANARWTRAY